MRGFLLTYNPGKSGNEYFDELVDEVEAYGEVQDNWSCANRSDLPPGSALLLMRLGVEPKGLVGLGTATAWPRELPHWNKERREAGSTSKFVDFRFTSLTHDPAFALDELSDRFPQVRWTPQRSGSEIPEKVLNAILAEWPERGMVDLLNPEEVQPGLTYPEGAVRRTTVNAYERSRVARDACIAHYGCACYACGLEMSDIYGELATGFIHVHHLRPLSELGQSYAVDPITDLVPLCPNCHAVIHLTSPALDVRELQARLAPENRTLRRSGSRGRI